MKKAIAVLILGLTISGLYAGRLPLGLEGGAGISISEGSNIFFLEGSGLLHIYRNFYARTELASLSFPSGGTIVSFGTGQGIDLMMFFRTPGITPYGIGGFHFLSGGGYSSFNLRLGGGAEFKLTGSPIKPFAEATIDIISISIGGSSSSTNVFTIKGGIRRTP